MKTVQNRLLAWALFVAGILSLPFITGAPWTTMDYLFAGIVLYGLAIFYEIVTAHMKQRKQRIAVGVGVLTIIGMIIAWAAA